MTIINKKGRNELFELFKQIFTDNQATIEGGPNPFILTYKGKTYNVYISNLTPAQLSNKNPNIWRMQLPIRKVFDEIKTSENMFLLLGYDSDRDVYATWNPYWTKQRLNIGENISMYSRLNLQIEISQQDKILKVDLNKNSEVVLFQRKRLPDYLDNIFTYFPQETTYVAIGSSLRKPNSEIKLEPSLFDISSDNWPEVNDHSLIKKIAAIMNNENPDDFEALTILSNYYGDDYNSTMKLNDWIEFLHKTDWMGLLLKNSILQTNIQTILNNGLKVSLNGRIIKKKTNSLTFAETIRQIGYRKIANLNIMFADGKYNLVCQKLRTDGSYKWQEHLGDWYIYTAISIEEMINILQIIEDKYNLKIKVIS